VIDCEVSPELQLFPDAKLEVKITLPPGQKVNGPLADIVGVEGVFTVTVIGVEEAEQPIYPEVTV
jgi:hypothetical protein